MEPNTILLDIMQDGRFVCQLKYNKRGFPVMVDGVIKESHDMRDIEDFVYQQRPSLRGKNISVEFATQKVFK